MIYCIKYVVLCEVLQMKNVLLIGDSIREGYDKAVKKTLEGQANVFFPSENCQFAAHVLRFFHNYLGDLKGEEIDVIHWNAGLWDSLRMFEEDPQTPLDVYGYYIERLCVRMKKLCPNAKFIFATSGRHKKLIKASAFSLFFAFFGITHESIHTFEPSFGITYSKSGFSDWV